MSEALDEVDNLIAGFLDGDLSDAQGERLAHLIETNPAAARAFDEALRTEALLRAAHVGAGVSASRTPSVTRVHFQPSRSWIAVAALLALMFGAAMYYKWIAPEKTVKVADTDKLIKNKTAKTDAACAVASGRVWVDGREASTIAENEWLNVAPEGPAKLKLGDRVEIELDAGSGALLRKGSATLLNGSGIFKIKPGVDKFTLETASGTVFMSGGEFSARLEADNSSRKLGDPQLKRNTTATLAVTVFAGSAQVGSNGKSTMMSVGDSRVYGGEGALPERPRPDGNPPGGPRPPEFGIIGLILDHARELELTDSQSKQLQALKGQIASNRDKMDSDPKVVELRMKLRAAADKGSSEAMRELRDALFDREQEVRKSFTPIANPHDILTEDQNRLTHDIMEENRPNRRPGDEGPPPPPRDGPPDFHPQDPRDGPPDPHDGDRRPPPPHPLRPPMGERPPPMGDRPPHRPGEQGEGPPPGRPGDGPGENPQQPDRRGPPSQGPGQDK